MGIYPGSKCAALKERLVNNIKMAFSAPAARAEMFAQQGAVDFGLVEGSGQSAASSCGTQGCFYSNPSSPYGMVLLPLNPRENLAMKIAANTTPAGVAERLGKYGGGRYVNLPWNNHHNIYYVSPMTFSGL